MWQGKPSTSIGTSRLAVMDALRWLLQPVDSLSGRRGWLTDNGQWTQRVLRLVPTALQFPTLSLATTRGTRTPSQAQRKRPSRCHPAAGQWGTSRSTACNSRRHPDDHTSNTGGLTATIDSELRFVVVFCNAANISRGTVGLFPGPSSGPRAG